MIQDVKQQPLVWKMRNGVSMLLRGQLMNSGRVLLAPRTFFHMIDIKPPKKLNAEFFRAVDKEVRKRFDFVRVLHCETLLVREGDKVIRKQRLHLRHNLMGVEYVVQIPKKGAKK